MDDQFKKELRATIDREQSDRISEGTKAGLARRKRIRAMATLDKLRREIEDQAPNIRKTKFAHNIVRLVLKQIDELFGRQEANRAVEDFDLYRHGFKKLTE